MVNKVPGIKTNEDIHKSPVPRRRQGWEDGKEDGEGKKEKRT